MKHIFVINPAAGPYDITEKLTARLEQMSKMIDYEIYCTTCRGDATRFVANKCENSNEEYRFYACGGDGTLNEVVRGVMGHDNASVSVLPCGSGNDFIKYYGTADDFNDLESLVNGVDQKIDVMKVEDKFAINVVNFGFETAVVKTMEKIKRIKFMTGKKAYIFGIFSALISAMRTKANVLVDGVKMGKSELLLGSVANGRYVGGSFKCAPRSLNDDGLLDVCIVDTISRFKFINLVGLYKKGTHLDAPRAKSVINFLRGRVIEVESQDELCYCIDGELNFSKKVTIEVLHKAIKFSVPKKIADKLGIIPIKKGKICVS